MVVIKHIAAVAISNTSFGYDKRYKYLVPVELDGQVTEGIRVLVPFGNGNRKRVALVLRVDNAEGQDLSKFKPMHSIIDKEPLIGKEMLDLLFWIRETTLCTYFEAFRTLIPTGLSVNFAQKYELCKDNSLNSELLSEKALQLLRKCQCAADLSEEIEKSDRSAVKELIGSGFIKVNDNVKRKTKDDTVRMAKLTEKYLENETSFNLSQKQKSITEILEESTAASVKEICYLCNVTPQVVKNLEKKGVISFFEYEVISTPQVTADENVDSIILTDEQQNVFSHISELIKLDKADAALLFGVTGSGKTSVFVKLIQYTLKLNKTVIMMIPEISLTPQMVSTFQSFFGDEVAVVHSSLSLSQRLNEYKRIKSGQAKIVVGTRSAVFSPLENIGLIIIDEEGERTYKSESAPRYNAKEIAKKRCVVHNAVLLMASATPSVESYYYAINNRYKLFTLTKRYSQNCLPHTEIVDMGSQAFYGSSSTFTERLIDEISYNIEHKEQTILLLNRRGYHTYVSCCDCREIVTCPNCSVPLTYHKVNERLICHYCGYSSEMIKKCQKCGSEHIKLTGFGTQKIEDEIQNLFPSAKILRMDADTTYSRYAYEKNFKAFEKGEYDIMVGTQMIAKGLDFPNVTLVGVLSVDKALFAGDFRSYERTFSLITQVVGRCGRGDKQGRAIIQTFVPEHYVINLAANQDYVEFFNQEISMRKALIYPPFCDTCVIGFSSVIDKCADSASKFFLIMMKEKLKEYNEQLPLRVLGPTKCIYEKINGKYRYRIIVKCKNNSEFRKFIGELWTLTFKKREFSNVQTYIDINGDIGI